MPAEETAEGPLVEGAASQKRLHPGGLGVAGMSGRQLRATDPELPQQTEACHPRKQADEGKHLDPESSPPPVDRQSLLLKEALPTQNPKFRASASAPITTKVVSVPIIQPLAE